MMELGATVCTPRAPACLTCPGVQLCATRGELAGATKVPRQKKREIHYALDCRHGKVFLVQRPGNARLMAGMWELPEVEAPASGAKAPSNGAGEIAAMKALRHPKAKSNAIESGGAPKRHTILNGANPTRGIDKERSGSASLCPCFTLRHSITTTDYTVRVWRMPEPNGAPGKWIPVQQLARVALTGLARKILRQQGRIAVSAGQV
jgi:adenine-specific DNA glycosylase